MTTRRHRGLAIVAALAVAGGYACTRHGESQPVAAPQPLGTAVASASGASSIDRAGPDSPHGDAIAHLLAAPWGTRADRRRVVTVPFPDAPQWTHVKYWGLTTLAGWRYGDDHHAMVAAFTFALSPATVDGCAAKFAAWGLSHAKQFDVIVGDARVEDLPWLGGKGTYRRFVLDAERRSILGFSRYASAYAVYPAWDDACLVVGLSVPERDSPEVARALRDRLVKDALPGVIAKPGMGKKALEQPTDVD